MDHQGRRRGAAPAPAPAPAAGPSRGRHNWRKLRNLTRTVSFKQMDVPHDVTPPPTPSSSPLSSPVSSRKKLSDEAVEAREAVQQATAAEVAHVDTVRDAALKKARESGSLSMTFFSIIRSNCMDATQ